MKYVRLNSGVVTAIIYDEDPSFPGLPVASRYPLSYIAELIPVPNDTEVSCGMILTEKGTWEYLESVPEPESNYSLSQEEVTIAYKEGVNNVE